MGVGKGSKLCGWAGEVGLSLLRGGGWVGWEQLGDFGGLVVPCSPFPRRHR